MAKQFLSNGNFRSKIKSDFFFFFWQRPMNIWSAANVNHLALDTVSNTTSQQICKKKKNWYWRLTLHKRSAGTFKWDHFPKQK